MADPAGAGKTLSAAMAIVRSKDSAERFATVVTTNTLVDQWKTEFAKYFEAVSRDLEHALPL